MRSRARNGSNSAKLTPNCRRALLEAEMRDPQKLASRVADDIDDATEPILLQKPIQRKKSDLSYQIPYRAT